MTSAMTRNQVVSFILSVVFGLFLILAGYPPVTSFVSSFAPSWAVDLVASLSFMAHYESLQRGVVEARDLLYFVSVIAVGLMANHQILNSKRG